jgi:hypothetical protein
VATVQASGKSEQKAVYTKGFDFGEDYNRAVVERACSAISVMMQVVFSRFERDMYALQEEWAGVDPAICLDELVSVLRQQSMIERALLNSVVCSFSGLVEQDNSAAEQDLADEIVLRLDDELDLMSLFGGAESIEHYTNVDRPLLIYLSSQLHGVFGVKEARLESNPLSPHTLVTGFLLGLSAVDVSLFARLMLFSAFEEEFLGKLSTLINNVVSRLEQEEIVASGGVVFNEQDPGSLGALLPTGGAVNIESLSGLAAQFVEDVGELEEVGSLTPTVELVGQDSLDGVLRGLALAASESRRIAGNISFLERAMFESGNVIDGRNRIAEEMNDMFEARKMPVWLMMFLQGPWSDVLYKIYMSEGEGEQWQECMKLQWELYTSVQLVEDADKLGEYSKQVPGLVNRLRTRLESAVVPVDEFMTKLKACHLQNIQKNLDVSDYDAWHDMPMFPASAGELWGRREELMKRVAPVTDLLEGVGAAAG